MTQVFKVKLAAIAKDEGFYLPLWVYHHFHFGFDVLDIRINNNTDNSVEVLEKLKTVYGDRLQYSFADKELKEAREQDVNFQTYIYKKILDETLKEDFTHLLFLDVDEYWCSKNFTHTIKDFLSQVSDFDVCMFQWLMESPDSDRKIDVFTFSTKLFGHKNAHVKSLAKLSAVITAVRAHNHIAKNGQYILPNNTIIKFAEDDQNRATVPEALFQVNRLKLDDYFVYHNIFRSQDEYISSLLRGNKIDGEDSLLKANRFGFVPTESVDFKLEWDIAQPVLDVYQQGYTSLITPLETELTQAQRLVLERKAAVLAYLQDDHFLQQVNANKMLGISNAIYTAKKPSYFIKAKVDQLAFDEQTLICSFICEIISIDLNYELIITHSTSKMPLAATINLLSTQQLAERWVRQYACALPISELSSLVYKRQPPFCLAAKLTTTSEWLLLERGKFRNIAPTLIPHAAQFRRNQRNQAAKLEDKSAEPLKKQPMIRFSFWRKLFTKLIGT